MAREEDGDGRIVHKVEYDGYSGRRTNARMHLTDCDACTINATSE